MKNLKKYFAAVLISGIAFTACDDPERREAEREFDEFKTYVSTNAERFGDEVEMEWDEYEDEWNEYDRGYQEHVTTIEDKREYLSDEDQKEFDRIQSDYDQMRNRYETRATEEINNTNNQSDVSRNMYASAGINDPSNMTMSDVNENNIRENYDGFVDYVDENQEQFDENDWKEADRINNAYNSRRNEVGNNISKTDNTELDRLEDRYNNISSQYNTNRDNTSTDNTGTNNRTGATNR